VCGLLWNLEDQVQVRVRYRKVQSERIVLEEARGTAKAAARTEIQTAAGIPLSDRPQSYAGCVQRIEPQLQVPREIFKQEETSPIVTKVQTRRIGTRRLHSTDFKPVRVSKRRTYGKILLALAGATLDFSKEVTNYFSVR